MCNSRKSAVPKRPLKVRICTQLSYVSSWGSASCAFPTFFWSTPLLAADHWLNRTNSPAISTETCSLHNCRTCYLSAAGLALEAELRMQPWLRTTVESEEWTTETKAIFASQLQNLYWALTPVIFPIYSISNPVRSFHSHI